MSKMTMPTVDVVRFQESDVIVASILTIGDHSNAKTMDGWYIYDKVKYFTENEGDHVDLSNALGDRLDVRLTNGDIVNIEDVFYRERNNEGPITNDGNYYWNSNGYWAQ